MVTKDKYLEILNLFLPEKDSPFIEVWQENIFNAVGRTMATNGRALAITPEIGYYPNHTKNVKHLYPLASNTKRFIAVSTLKELLQKFPKKQIQTYQEAKCGVCSGKGFWYNERGFETECSNCAGEGIEYFDPKLVETDDFHPLFGFKINTQVFNPELIQLLVKSAEILEWQTIMMFHERGHNKPVGFAIFDCEFIIMPTMQDLMIGASLVC